MSEQRYPQKMYASKMFRNVRMFKRPDLSPRNDGEWKEIVEDQYDVEVINDKARVYSNNPFVHKPSRFCKLKPMGAVSGNMRIYQLTVNGQQTFFKITYIIRD